ncbi:MAG: hypothetical protein D3916_05710 [Candidatus Electrothrix sp. MAN1_4]|nr:hypothetical protein [Candidatus Electrothrix sp. MAN1_4]
MLPTNVRTEVWDIRNLVVNIHNLLRDIRIEVLHIQKLIANVHDLLQDVRNKVWDVRNKVWDVQNVVAYIRDLVWNIQNLVWNVPEEVWYIPMLVRNIRFVVLYVQMLAADMQGRFANRAWLWWYMLKEQNFITVFILLIQDTMASNEELSEFVPATPPCNPHGYGV